MMTIRESHIIIKIDFDPELCGNFVALPSLRSGLLTWYIHHAGLLSRKLRLKAITLIHMKGRVGKQHIAYT